jgi:CheY-like chemotaxis protein
VTRVLFVDDEPALLRGFERGMATLRPSWQAAFAAGGTDALALVEREPYDVIVSDLSMPGMDGVELFTRVRRRQPGITRIVLSGHASSMPPPQALSVVHQWFGKPRTTRQLRTALDVAIWARSLVDDVHLRDVLLGALTVRVSETAARAVRGATGDELARIVAMDPGLAAKVLQTANGSFFGDAQRVTCIRTAVSTIGDDGVRTIASQVCEAAPTMPSTTLHASHIAMIASELAPPALRADAYAAGLLHEVARLLPGSGADPHLVARASGLLLASWQLPLEVARAVAHQLDPETSPVPDDPILDALVRAKALARSSYVAA